MATRQNTVLLKRSNVIGKIPLLSGLTIGELALNTADAKLYSLYTSGTTGATEVRQIGWDRISRTGDTVTGDFNFFGDVAISGSSQPNGYTLSVTGDTFVLGNNTQIGNFDITGNTSQFGNLNITGNTTQYGNITLSGNTFITGNTEQIGDFTITGNTYQSGNTTQIGTFNLTGDTNQIGNFTITGDTVQSGSTTQYGNVDLTGNTTQIGSVTLSGNSFITGNTDQLGNFNITGNTTQSGNTFQNGNFNITGNTDQVGNVNITGNTVIDGSLSADTITITNLPTLNNTLFQILGRNETTGDVEYRQVNTVGNNITIISGGTYSAQTTVDNVIGVDTTTGTTTIYLPDSILSGRLRFEIKDIGLNAYNNPITIIAAGTDTIISYTNSQTLIMESEGGAIILLNTGLGQWWQM